MNRLVILDGFRGFFLLFMAIAHYNGLTQVWLGALHHQYVGWVEDAQGFVFISGLVVGLVYGKKFLRTPSIRAIFAPILARIRTIYSHHAGLIVILLGAALALGAMAPTDLAPYQAAPGAFTLSSFALLSSSTHMGILPMYIFFLLATPFAFRLLHREQLAPYFVLMGVLWLAAQTSLAGLGMHKIQLWLEAREIFPYFGIYFNLFGWQILFFSGLFIGFRMAQGRLDLGFLRQPQWRPVFFLALGAVVLLGIYDRVIEEGWLGLDYSLRMLARSERPILGTIYPIAFALDLFLVVWLLQTGVDDRLGWVRRASAGLNWLFTRRFLTILGEHSLHVFSFHLLIYYALATGLALTEPSAAIRTVALAVATLSIYLAAFGHGALQKRAAAGATAKRAEGAAPKRAEGAAPKRADGAAPATAGAR